MWTKTAATAAVMAVLATGAIASSGDGSGSYGDSMMLSMSGMPVQVTAETVMTTAELARSGYDAKDIITVTAFPSSGEIDRSSANGG